LLHQTEKLNERLELTISLHHKNYGKGSVWMNQNQLAKLFDTSKQNIDQHASDILNEGELNENSVVKKFFTTAADGKKYDMING
ncbi:MAG: hypothetical protein ACOC10_09245, partial [Bacteroidota bacterium]